MAALGGLFVIASLVIGIMALFKGSPVRRWYASRRNPRRAAGISVTAWAVVFILLLVLTPAPPEDTTDSDALDATATLTTGQQARSATASNTAVPTTSSPAAPSGVPDDAQQAEVRRIVDGDTLELAALAAGTALGSTAQVDVRLLEIDAPETKHPSKPVQCYGEEATARLEELAPPGSTVWIQRDGELRDRYGRYLLYLWNDDGVFVNLDMVEGGYADAVLYQPNDLYWEQISAARDEAKTTDTGLWGACSPCRAPKTPPEPEPEPEPRPQPQPEPEPEPEDNYVVPAPPPDLDCGDIPHKNFRVRPGDPHRFDSDGDGIGCES